MKIVKANDSQFILMENEDIIGQELSQRGAFSAQEVEICRRFISESEEPIVLDIGANIGTFTVPVAKTLNFKNGYIISFEPQRVIFQQLCANIFINQLDNCRAINAAVGDCHEELEIPVLNFFKSTNPGGFTTNSDIRIKLLQEYSRGTTARNEFIPGKFESVQMITIDSLRIKEKISFIKLDVEGNELYCLKGMRETLDWNRFPPIVFEDWRGKFEWYTERSLEIEGVLKNLGYKIIPLSGRNYIAQHLEHPIRISFD
ncbi:MAG: hypothetical protein RIS90_3081 [Pseudomonadota bacterium]|jgi:FkbM family methyltransferase